MNHETIFRLITILVVSIIFTISVSFRRRAEKQAGQLRSKEGQGAVRLVRLYVLLVWVVILAYLINPTWVQWAQMPLPIWVRSLGAGLVGLAIPLVYWVFVSLGLNISPTQSTRLGATLVTHGPYRWVRHPLYSVGCMAYLGLTLLTALWPILVGLIPALVFIIWRTPKEEARLIETFGEAYRTYMVRTGRYVPRLW
ncbi:MAG: isoprenylcysteine carboxylmethyltransferase family protein [Anaerolineae bacterium]|nr:isoprenylcysteine carboxylmethyltransferase family protein [Anaerolineae bacterium]